MNALQDFFTVLNSFFDNIYVITLQRARDRHAHIRNELAGLHYEFFFGKDKQTFSIEELKEKGIYNEALSRQHHRYGKPMQGGQIGCAWSHAEVYKDVVEKGYKKVLILEDDIVIDKKRASMFSQIVSALPANWELLYLGFDEREKAPKGVWLKKIFYHVLSALGTLPFSHKTINHLYPKKISNHIYRAGYHDCTHAYALTASAAKKLLKLQQPISFIADNLLAYAATNTLVNAYIILPKIIYQQYQLGTITASYLND